MRIHPSILRNHPSKMRIHPWIFWNHPLIIRHHPLCLKNHWLWDPLKLFHHHAHQPPVRVTLRKTLYPEDFDNPPKLNCRTNLIRSESTACITKCEENKRSHRNVFYVNISQYDDRLYMNELFSEQSHIRMKCRIDRWNRLSDELKEVNEDAAQRHWSYFDNQFKHRSRDDSYKK